MTVGAVRVVVSGCGAVSERYRLPRVFVDDWSGADFERCVLGAA